MAAEPAAARGAIDRVVERLPDWLVRPGIAAGCGWLVAYLAVCLTGQPFSTAYLGYGWQLIPWDILSSDPWRSVWYLHVQPPLWNLTLGVPAWVSPFSDAITLQVLLAGFGVAGAVFAALLAERLGVRRRWATLIALGAMVHPEVLKLAFEPTYELAVATLLLAILWAAARYADTPERHGALLAVAALGTAVVLTRSLYHPLWLAAVLVVCWWVGRGRVSARSLAVAVLVPLTLIGGWMLKNQALYDRATLSSWFGMNLQRAVIPVLDLDDLERLHADGEVSDIALIGPFGTYELYAPVMPPCTPSHGHRSVTEPDRTTDPYSPNFNYECYLPVFDRAGKDAGTVIRRHPGAFVEGRLWSIRATFAVDDTPGAFTTPASPSVIMRALDTVYSAVRLDYQGVLSTDGWGTPIYGRLIAPTAFGLVPVAMYAGLVVCGTWHAWVLVRRRARDPGRSVVLALGALTTVWTVVVGAVAELGEQARFRTMVDALVWVLVLAELVRAGTIILRRHTPSPSGGS